MDVTAPVSRTACAYDRDGRLVPCCEVSDRLKAADLAAAEGPGHAACARALRATARRHSEVHVAELMARRQAGQ